MVFVARYLSKVFDQEITFKSSLLPLWLPVFAVLILILPANFSTTAIIFTMLLVLAFLGGYPLKYIGAIVGTGLLVLAFFVLVAKAFPDAMPNRVDTWTSRIVNFMDDRDTEEDYQIEKAKIAIATGSIYGLGPGKSVQKNFLPQSSSDFIFAIIVEEFGIIGGSVIIRLYVLMFFRILIITHKADDKFGKILVSGLGILILVQAFTNISVATQTIPVTGQNLPLISSGGSSAWMTCISLGMILSVSSSIKKKKIG